MPMKAIEDAEQKMGCREGFMVVRPVPLQSYSGSLAKHAGKSCSHGRWRRCTVLGISYESCIHPKLRFGPRCLRREFGAAVVAVGQDDFTRERGLSGCPCCLIVDRERIRDF